MALFKRTLDDRPERYGLVKSMVFNHDFYRHWLNDNTGEGFVNYGIDVGQFLD
jgi:hypothetical protein